MPLTNYPHVMAWLLSHDGQGRYFVTKNYRILFEVSEIIREGLIRKRTAIVVWAQSVKRHHNVTLSTLAF